jgi:Phosphotransferase system cellobiose-specific component IIB
MTKTIMLACAGGMSTSLLVTKMIAAAKAEKIDVNIFATASSAISLEADTHHPSVILLGPQIQFLLDNIIKEVDVPVEVINMKDYGTMNGKNVLHQAMKLIN